MQLFETPRLSARQLSHQDLPALADILSDPEVMKYSVRGVCDRTATRKFIDWCLESYSDHSIGPWALIEKASDTFVGFCGIGPEWVADAEEINLGYRLARNHWNKGIATEAVKGVLNYAFTEKGINSVIAIIEPAHGASLRVSEKAGFRHYKILNFHDRSVRLYRMTHQDWHQLPSDIKHHSR